VRNSAAESRDPDHTFDAVARHHGAGREAEIEIGGRDARGARIGWHEPEHRVGAGERLVDDIAVAVRAVYHLNVLPIFSGDAGRVAGDDPDLFTAADEKRKELAADGAGGCGDDDHAHAPAQRRFNA
jgi:hypothetical protein